MQQDELKKSSDQAVGAIVDFLALLADQQKKKDDAKAFKKKMDDGYKLRDNLYVCVERYCLWFTNNDLLLQTPTYAYNEDQRDKLIIYPNRNLDDIKDALQKHNGMRLDSLMQDLTPSYSGGSHFENYLRHIKNPFDETIYNDENTVHPANLLNTRFGDSRSRKEKKLNDPNDIRATVPYLTAAYMFRNRIGFDTLFINYQKTSVPMKNRVITQWLYQADASLAFDEWTTSKKPELLTHVLSGLQKADKACTLTDYSPTQDKSPFSVPELLTQEYYWENLLVIKLCELNVLRELYTQQDISAEQKAIYIDLLISVYYQTEKDMAPVLQNAIFQQFPKVVEDHTN